MKEDKFTVLFLGASSHAYDTIPEELLQRWDFQFKSISDSDFVLHELPHVVVLDTYSLGLRSLDRVKARLSTPQSAILVLDDYQERILIESILARGAAAYLHIDNFADGLEHHIEALLPPQKPSDMSLNFFAAKKGHDSTR